MAVVPQKPTKGGIFSKKLERPIFLTTVRFLLNIGFSAHLRVAHPLVERYPLFMGHPVKISKSFSKNELKWPSR